jgi:hypothetical protein
VPVAQGALLGRFVVGVDADPDRVRRAARYAEAVLSDEQRARVRVVREETRNLDRVCADWIGQTDLVLFDVPPPIGGEPKCRRGLPAGDLRLLEGAAFAVALEEAFAAAARLLRPGGYMAVVCRRGVPRPRPLDRVATCVRCASAAGLSYVQHVIALAVPIRGDRLAADEVPSQVLNASHAAAAATLVSPVHDDVCVFTRPEVVRDAEVGL